MRLLFVFLIAISTISCTQNKQTLLGETKFQKKMNADFKDVTTSPLKEEDLKHFRGLDFFKFDSSFVVEAKLKHTPDEAFFDMKTTTDRVSEERVYGVLSFILKDESFELKVYQGKTLMETEGYEDYLFLPFLDETNGEHTYGGGRYIDLRIPKDDTVILDFNTAYNPLCAYNDKYSCPIVPRQNYLNTKVKAGVKAFKKH
ncbi:MAG: DUF1684 domain-containing protein [Flavobacteriaceae bacterium]|nr:DUF1684 domain-containing protein [Flavobacteriaceae bacterium]